MDVAWMSRTFGLAQIIFSSICSILEVIAAVSGNSPPILVIPVLVFTLFSCLSGTMGVLGYRRKIRGFHMAAVILSILTIICATQVYVWEIICTTKYVSLSPKAAFAKKVLIFSLTCVIVIVSAVQSVFDSLIGYRNFCRQCCAKYGTVEIREPSPCHPTAPELNELNDGL